MRGLTDMEVEILRAGLVPDLDSFEDEDVMNPEEVGCCDRLIARGLLRAEEVEQVVPIDDERERVRIWYVYLTTPLGALALRLHDAIHPR